MPKSKKASAVDKLNRKKEKKIVVLETNFAGAKAGQTMLVGTPLMIDAYIRAIPVGQHRTLPAMHNALAKRYKCDVTCPVSTAIFVRMSAEAALEELENGKAEADITPFWRLLSSDEKIAKRLNLDPAWIDHRRELEGLPL